MKKIAYNNCYGGFSISLEAVKLARQLSGNPKWGDCVLPGETYNDGTLNKGGCFVNSYYPDISRADPILIQVIEQLGEAANGQCAELKITTVSGKWRISEYDGNETVQEPEDIQWCE
jgi:hypothetical protein